MYDDEIRTCAQLETDNIARKRDLRACHSKREIYIESEANTHTHTQVIGLGKKKGRTDFPKRRFGLDIRIHLQNLYKKGREKERKLDETNNVESVKEKPKKVFKKRRHREMRQGLESKELSLLDEDEERRKAQKNGRENRHKKVRLCNRIALIKEIGEYPMAFFVLEGMECEGRLLTPAKSPFLSE